jgi:hypothetical protein
VTEPGGIGDGHGRVVAGWSGEHGQREGREADGECQQRRDGVAEVGGALGWWSASIAQPQATEGSGEQQRAGGDEQRDGVRHGGMVAHG